MTIHSLPDDLYPSAHADYPPDDINIFNYHSQAKSEKSRVTLHHNVFSFIIDGSKEVSYLQKKERIDNSQFLLLSSGNCLMSQKAASENGLYNSALLFFSNSVLVDFFLKYPTLITRDTRIYRIEEPFISFQQDEFIRNFVHSLTLMSSSAKDISKDMKRLKFEEIMLYLCDKFPAQILSLHISSQESVEDLEIRKMVESNFESNITVEELAFLCNTSLSTFKRRFSKIYGSSPNKWMLHKRMELAASLLEHSNEKPSEIYYKVGYENLSSFIESFKRIYGITPKEYQTQKLNA